MRCAWCTYTTLHAYVPFSPRQNNQRFERTLKQLIFSSSRAPFPSPHPHHLPPTGYIHGRRGRAVQLPTRTRGSRGDDVDPAVRPPEQRRRPRRCVSHRGKCWQAKRRSGAHVGAGFRVKRPYQSACEGLKFVVIQPCPTRQCTRPGVRVRQL